VSSWEKDANPSLVAALGRIIGRLPSIWETRREASRLVESLPRFPRDLELPDQETIYAWIEELCRTPHRRPGTEEGQAAERWVADRLRELGLQEVTLDPVPITAWSARRWSLTAGGAKIPCFYVVNSGFTPPEGVKAPMVFVGQGRPRDFAGKPVRGKIVVADVPFPRLPTGVLVKLLRIHYELSDPERAMSVVTNQLMSYVRKNFIGGAEHADEAPARDVYWQAQRRGAAGICLILRDQPANSNSHYGPYDGIMKPLPGLWVGKRDGEQLRWLARRQELATLTLEGEATPSALHNVWGVLPGRSEETILVTSHHDAPFKGAIEDGAGVAQVLAQAWIWSRVPREERPKTMVFVLDGGHFYGSVGAHAFAREHQEIMARSRVLLTLEHLGGKDVRERAGRYEETGQLAFTVMFTSPQAELVAAVMRALRESPTAMTAAIPSDLLGPSPTSDAMGYVLEAGVPVVSWIGCPYYLLDEHDTLDKVDRAALRPICRTATELTKSFMALP
jgi:hypothetical protein